MHQTLPPPANPTQIAASHFLLYCGRNSRRFTLRSKRRGAAKVFPSMVNAIAYAREIQPKEGARVTVINAEEGVAMEWFI